MKEVSLLEMVGRSLAKVAAGAGVAAVLIWLTYVMLDVGHMQSGFTLIKRDWISFALLIAALSLPLYRVAWICSNH